MKQNDDMDVLVNHFIRLYTVKPKVKTIKKKEIQDFQRFIFASTQNHPKYNQIQTDLMMYVKSFDEEIYKKISGLENALTSDGILDLNESPGRVGVLGQEEP